ncbi:mechanosensitive ion channel domain-containing protein [Spirosoma sp.]|uniref:mechanosensitive ion channel family protein n=1 Tax=Spirosoma sp. TaxID=1899569 RepID=UPI002607FAE4|nr:mechanosensitive ion channel domain-containing protein [Spirosoma sp.]MCX6214185.1 mechanosensitive ion channel [Spirosoma sp.]
MRQLPNLTEILRNTFQTLIDQFIDFVPRIIGALVILLIGVGVARLAAFVVQRVLGQVGFDKIGDRLNQISVIKQLNTEIKLSEIIAKVLYYFILLVFIMAATETLGVAAITEMVSSLVNFIPKLLAAAIMLQVGVLLADTLRGAVVNLCQSFNIAAGRLLSMIVFAFFLIVTIISALGQAGINTELLESSFNLIIGGVIFAFAIGYGIASRDIMANVLSSFYTKNKYKEGQLVQIDDVKGEILKIDTLSITLRTGDTTTIVPLQTLQSKNVEVFD